MNTGTFLTFSYTHIATLALIGLISIVFVFVARSDKTQKFVKPICYALSFILIVNEFSYLIYLIVNGLWTYKWGLPLQLCDLAIFATAFSLIKHKQFIWEIAYFWGLGGTVQALLTPDLQITFPDYIYIKFFLTHGCIVIGVIFLAAGLRRPIYFKSLKRILIVTNIYAAFIALFNWQFNTNYLYLCRKPTQPSIIDFMGPWPTYMIGLEIVLIISLIIYYLPYYLHNKYSHSRLDKV